MLRLEYVIQLVLHMFHEVNTHKRHEISLHGFLVDDLLPLLSPLTAILKLCLILRTILSRSVLSLPTVISLPLLLLIVPGLLLSLIMIDVIVSIGILAAEGRIGVKGNLIIVAIESICQIIVGIQKFISVSVDLKINIAVLDAKGIVIAID